VINQLFYLFHKHQPISLEVKSLQHKSLHKQDVPGSVEHLRPTRVFS